MKKINFNDAQWSDWWIWKYYKYETSYKYAIVVNESGYSEECYDCSKNNTYEVCGIIVDKSVKNIITIEYEDAFNAYRILNEFFNQFYDYNNLEDKTNKAITISFKILKNNTKIYDNIDLYNFMKTKKNVSIELDNRRYEDIKQIEIYLE